MIKTDEEIEAEDARYRQPGAQDGSRETAERRKHDETTEELAAASEPEIKKVRFNSERHILREEAQGIKPEVQAGEELEFALEARSEFGRIASQTAKQVIIQRIREVEREATYHEYKIKEGEIVSGIVQRLEGRNVFLDLGRGVGILPAEEQIPRERYVMGERLKALLLAVEKDIRGPGILLSRSHPRFLKKLFELEVPEITAGSVEIKAVAREAGSRSKIAVASNDPAIDPVGSMVGQRGVRVSTVMNEIGGEKIDIIEWAEDPARFIANALSPARVADVTLSSEMRTATVLTPPDQLSLAIGKGGQNVRLAAKLTGWKIDVRSLASPIEAPASTAAPEGDVLPQEPEPRGESETPATAAKDSEPPSEVVPTEQASPSSETSEIPAGNAAGANAGETAPEAKAEKGRKSARKSKAKSPS
ncbi:MAG: transcription termination/antitermination protein NusA [Candidatus Sungbacteria bacterium]|uniref:Transcription termination/antitermination protein NusA n=1 Tax=Candidatus Sungiibacteriota bacterium TaxID=2750080 RepID=A0A932YXG0_9BACT|nr:transcription termination/antitermination protein NusA [Candidatus Sungbacteria bacterium]